MATPVPRSKNKSVVNAVQNNARALGVPNVGFVRNELRKKLGEYRRIADCISGTDAVKARGDEYLPRPNAADKSKANIARYDAYIARAVFYAVTYRTARALVGQIFLRDPIKEFPDSFKAIDIDVNGENVSVDQLTDQCAMHTLAYGRAGLHVDYTTASDAGVTAADVEKGDARPVIYEYPGASIINWRKARRGSRMVYNLIVVATDYVSGDDGFETRTDRQYKVLRLVPAATVQATLLETVTPEVYGDKYDYAVNEAISSAKDVYLIEEWRSNGDSNEFAVSMTYYPKDHTGKFLNEIPFQFVGSEENDDSIDNCPLGPLAEVNLAHYRNSADYEESVFLIGQPTPFVSGVTQEWNQQVLKGVIQLGSRGAIVLPNGGTAGLIQAEENTLAKGAMDQKERQMVALGAKLVEQRETQRTATEAEMESTADTSVLAKVAGNVSSAMEWALKTCCLFTGDNPDSIKYVLNKEFDMTRMPADARQQLLLEYAADMITEEEMRANLMRAGIASTPYAQFKVLIEKQRADRLDRQMQLAQATQVQTHATLPGGFPPPAGSGGNSPGNTEVNNGGTKPGGNSNPKPNGQ